MKKLISLLFTALICLSLFACGSESQPVTDSTPAPDTAGTSQTEPTPKPRPYIPDVQGITTFMGDIRPYAVEKTTDDQLDIYYSLGLGGKELAQQYLDTLLNGNYELSLSDSVLNTQYKGQIFDYYYIKYTGEPQVRSIRQGLDWHMYVATTTYKDSSAVVLSVGYANSLMIEDDGYRADFSALENSLYPPKATPMPTPTPTPGPIMTGATPTPAPTPVPETVKPAAKPSQSGSSHTASNSVNKNASYIPDFTAFLGKNPSEDKDRYYGGTRKYYQKLPLDTQDTVVSEVLDLLGKGRYQLKLIEKVDTGNSIEYNYSYTGNVAMDSIHSKNDDSRYYNLQFTVYNKNNKSGTYGIHFHYAPQFTEENVGYTVSIGLSGGSNGGGGTVDFEGGDLPDHSKLKCLTCRGDGDCNSCNGKGYKIKDDIKSVCTRCSHGECQACGGSGTRS